jgi:hypothetical protein
MLIYTGRRFQTNLDAFQQDVPDNYNLMIRCHDNLKHRHSVHMHSFFGARVM